MHILEQVSPVESKPDAKLALAGYRNGVATHGTIGTHRVLINPKTFLVVVTKVHHLPLKCPLRQLEAQGTSSHVARLAIQLSVFGFLFAVGYGLGQLLWLLRFGRTDS